MEEANFYTYIGCSADDYDVATKTDGANDFAKENEDFFEWLIDFANSLENLSPITSYLSKNEKERGHPLTVREAIKLLQDYKK